MSETKTEFGQQLREHRKERALTQEALALRTKCAISTIRAYEMGRRTPSRAMARKIANILKLQGDSRTSFVDAARASPRRAAGKKKQEQAKTGRGRPPIDPNEKANSSRRSIFQSQRNWENLDQLADVMGAIAPSGPNYGGSSWRSLMSGLADQAPEIIAFIQERAMKPSNGKMLRFTVVEE